MATFDIEAGEYFSLDEQGKINFISKICRKLLLYSIENEISLENMIQEISVLESQATESEHYEMSEIFKLSVQGLKELQNELENGTNNIHDEGW
jgi:cell fate (sporulation/competence/biofilm development) regulator YmcA (YheA/YmcA/DUF963 family)